MPWCPVCKYEYAGVDKRDEARLCSDCGAPLRHWAPEKCSASKNWPVHLVSTMGFVFDNRGNVLLGRHPRRGWDFPGGKVENGEHLEEGLLREILEESGISARMGQLVAVYSNVAPIYREDLPIIPTMVMFDFLCDYQGGELLASDEALEVIWAPKAVVLDCVEHPVSRMRYHNLLGFDGRVKYCVYGNDPEFHVVYERYL